MIISFCIIFLKNLSRVMRHKKIRKIQEKTKNWQNHEGSYNLGKTFWNPKKLLISSIGKKYQLCALLESGIGGLYKHSILKYDICRLNANNKFFVIELSVWERYFREVMQTVCFLKIAKSREKQWHRIYIYP